MYNYSHNAGFAAMPSFVARPHIKIKNIGYEKPKLVNYALAFFGT